MMKRFFAACLMMSLWLQPAVAGTLVASIHPVYLISQAVTRGIEQPVLLIPPQQDGHHIQLTPKDRQRLKQSDFIVWIGPEYEAALSSTLQQSPHAVAITRYAPLNRLPLRTLKGQTIANTLDPHVWLDPHNAIAIAQLIANVRGRQFPQRAAQYQRNALVFAQQLTAALPKTSKTSSAYWSFHDAYQYLERSQQLSFAGSLSLDPELPPTATQRQWLINARPTHPTCLVTAQPINDSLLGTLKPVQPVLIDETFAQFNDFVAAWQHLSVQLKPCKTPP